MARYILRSTNGLWLRRAHNRIVSVTAVSDVIEQPKTPHQPRSIHANCTTGAKISSVYSCTEKKRWAFFIDTSSKYRHYNLGHR